MLSGDPWLYLNIDPLVECSESGEPTRVLVSVVDASPRRAVTGGFRLARSVAASAGRKSDSWR